MKCQLCAAEKSARELNRCCGLAMCDRCHEGDLQEAFERLGVTYELTTKRRETKGATWHHLDISARYPGPGVAFHGQFSREVSGKFTRKILDAMGRGDPKVGESLFDDFVLVDAEEDGALMKILRSNHGLQDAIMELLSNQGQVELTHQQILIRIVQADTLPQEPVALRGLGALVAHLVNAGYRPPHMQQ